MKMMNTQNNRNTVAWMHEVMSFVILYCESRCIINTKQNHKKIYLLQIVEKQIPMGKASNLYGAFIWFHNNLAEYQEKLYETWLCSRYIGLGHPILLKSPDYLFLYDMIQAFKRKTRNEFGLSPYKFYRIFVSFYKDFRPGMYILDLQTDLESQKNRMYAE